MIKNFWKNFSIFGQFSIFLAKNAFPGFGFGILIELPFYPQNIYLAATLEKLDL